MKKTEYIFIKKEVFSEMHLSGNDAILYSLIAGYCENGVPFDMRIEDIARRVNLSNSGVRSMIDSLCERGFIEKERKQFCNVYNISDNWRKPIFEIAKKCHSRKPKSSTQDSQKIAVGSLKSSTPDSQTLANTHYNNNYIYNNPITSGGKGDFYGLFLEIFCSHYRSEKNIEYIPNNQTQTTAGRSLVEKIKTTMVHDGYVADEDTFKRYFSQWLDLAYKRSDNFVRERWTTEWLDKNFNYFNSIVNNNEYRQAQQHNRSNQGGISDDYVMRQFQKIANSRARADGSGSPE